MSRFQSAPALCRAGDRIAHNLALAGEGFQSAPALCRAGDRRAALSSRSTTSFNPRPLFAERATAQAELLAIESDVSIRARSLQSGRRNRDDVLGLVEAVSIRARSLQSGRLKIYQAFEYLVQFQSAPALCRAGDTARQARLSSDSRFNPRPLFAERATLPSAPFPIARRRFNPRPLFAERATLVAE